MLLMTGVVPILGSHLAATPPISLVAAATGDLGSPFLWFFFPASVPAPGGRSVQYESACNAGEACSLRCLNGTVHGWRTKGGSGQVGMCCRRGHGV